MLAPSLNEDGEIDEIKGYEAWLHFLSIGWKVLFALIPPKHFCRGKVAFCMSMVFIGIITAIVGEFAELFGCIIGLKSAVTAISFVALGTSLPDMFASKQAAQESPFADAAIGNIMGSNSVNVFLGLGLPWVIATIYYKNNGGGDYMVPAGELGFSVGLFLIVSVLCILTLIIRRCVSLSCVK